MSRPLSTPKPHTAVVVSRPWERSNRQVHQLGEGIDWRGEYALRLVCGRIVRHPQSSIHWGWLRYDLLDPSIPLCPECWEG
jgi:hypothetical protein